MNGSCVTMIMKTSAGISGARRDQAALRRRAPTPGAGDPAVVEAAVIYCPAYFLPTSSAIGWLLLNASATDVLPAIAELMNCETSVPSFVNSGMSTNWIPSVGRGCTPGFFGSADSIDPWVVL